MFRTAETGYCLAIFLEQWDAPPGRYFLSYTARHGFSALIGNGVVDEYRTISAPLLVCPTALLGKIYDAGMLLADRRDVDAPLDLGWPPLCMGIDVEPPSRQLRLAANWQEQFLAVLTGQTPGVVNNWNITTDSSRAGSYRIQVIRCGGPGPRKRVTIIGTDAPLLPGQLTRMADRDDSGLTLAVASGNRIARSGADHPQEIAVVSEEILEQLTEGVASLLA